MGAFSKMSGADCRRFLSSSHPRPLLVIFRTRTKFSSPSRAYFGEGKETAATQDNHFLEVAHAGLSK